MLKKIIPTSTIRESKDLLCIDALKGIGAIIIAFFWHYQHFIPFPEFPLSRIFEISCAHGYLMVELFFMLSGFGMALGYQKKIQNKEIGFLSYIKKRFCKLYPPFLAALFATGFLECVHITQTGATFIYDNFDLYHFLLNLLLLQNGLITTEWSFNSPSWCICICMLCYIIFYIAAYKSAKEQPLFYKCIIALFFAEYLLWGTEKPIFNTQIARGISCFSIGVMLSYAWRYKDRINYQYLGKIFLLLLIGGYIAIRYNPHIAGNMQQLFILGIGPVIILTSLFHKHLNLIFQNKIFTFLGSISLNIYLWHYPIQCAIKNLDLIFSLNLDYSSIISWSIYVTTTLVVAFFDKYFASRYYNKILSAFIAQFRPNRAPNH